MRMRKGKPAILLSAAGIFGIFAICSVLEFAHPEAGGPEQDQLPRQGLSLPVVTDPEDSYFHDRDTLYEDDEESSIVYMYLTVMRGNEADHTDHTWEEVNAYSTDWYRQNGMARYNVEGLLQVGDENGPTEDGFGYAETASNCTVQVRGQTSSRSDQKNYKIRIKKGKGKWRNQRTLALNKHVGDPFRFINKLNYDLMKQIPQLISARTQFVHLSVRDLTEGADVDFVDYGLFTQVEQMNQTYLENHGLDRNGQMYKVTFFEWDKYDALLAWEEDPEHFDQAAFEAYIEPKASRDHGKLLRVLDQVNDYMIPIEQIIEEHFDAENLCYWMAFHILTGNYDTGARNLFLYSPLNSEKWYVISWDNDASFRKTYYRRISKYIDGNSWECGLTQFTGLRLINRMMKEPEYREMLAEAVETLRTEYMTEEKLRSMVQEYRAVVKPLAMQPVDIRRVDEEEYDMLADALPAEVEANYLLFQENLLGPWPFYVGTPYFENGKLVFNWNASYDPNGSDVYYHLKLCRDLYGEDILCEADTEIPMYRHDPLPAGMYYLKLQAVNENGYSQDCYDYTVCHGIGKIYATLAFEIMEDGTIDVIEEISK